MKYIRTPMSALLLSVMLLSVGCARENKVRKIDHAFLDGLRNQRVVVLPVEAEHEGNTMSNAIGAGFGAAGVLIAQDMQRDRADPFYVGELNRSTQTQLVAAAQRGLRSWRVRVSGVVAVTGKGTAEQARRAAENHNAAGVLVVKPHFQAKQGMTHDTPALATNWKLLDSAGKTRLEVQTWAFDDESLPQWTSMDTYNPEYRPRLMEAVDGNAASFVELLTAASQEARATPQRD